MTFDALAEIRKYSPERRPLLKRGCEREPYNIWWNKLLRRGLAALGYTGALALDGDSNVLGTFDARLDSVVRQYQSAKGVTVDGEVGPVTWSLIAGEPQADPAPAPATKETERRREIRESIVAVARFMCDTLQIREHAKNNHGPEVALILALAKGKEGWHWCAACATAAMRIGHALKQSYAPKINTLSCSALIDDAIRQGRLRAGKGTPGDLFVLKGGDTGHYHIGVVEKVEGDRVTIIDGNSGDPQGQGGDGVYRHTHRISKGDFVDVA